VPIEALCFDILPQPVDESAFSEADFGSLLMYNTKEFSLLHFYKYFFKTYPNATGSFSRFSRSQEADSECFTS